MDFFKAAMKYIWQCIYVSASISLNTLVCQKYAGCLLFASMLEYNISRLVIQ